MYLICARCVKYVYLLIIKLLNVPYILQNLIFLIEKSTNQYCIPEFIIKYRITMISRFWTLSILTMIRRKYFHYNFLLPKYYKIAKLFIIFICHSLRLRKNRTKFKLINHIYTVNDVETFIHLPLWINYFQQNKINNCCWSKQKQIFSNVKYVNIILATFYRSIIVTHYTPVPRKTGENSPRKKRLWLIRFRYQNNSFKMNPQLQIYHSTPKYA